MLQALPLTTPWQHPDTRSSWHLYVIRIDGNRAGKPHRAVFEELRQAGIGVNLHYIPIHRQPWYEQLGFKPGHCPEAERYYEEAITLPVFPRLTDEQQGIVVDALGRVLAG
jgi:dTDP-4-amino-4,6-dideoxygalactose transaminase